MSGVDIRLDENNDISFVAIRDKDYINQMIYHAVSTRYGELIRHRSYGNTMFDSRIKYSSEGQAQILDCCHSAIMRSGVVYSIDSMDLRIVDGTVGDHILIYTVTTNDGLVVTNSFEIK